MSDSESQPAAVAARDHADEPAPLRATMDAAEPVTPRPTALVVLAGWLVPGLGYWLLGLRSRALAAGVTILALFVAGLLVGGVRVVDLPGYREGGVKAITSDGSWTLTGRPVAAVLDKPWFLGQVLAGPVSLIAGYGGLVAAANQIPKSTAHVQEFGTLYTAVAGMLNLLVVLDAGRRAGGEEVSIEKRDVRMPEVES